MSKKRGKSVSFDAMIKFFMQQYDIPTKKDIEKLLAKIDRLEILINSISTQGKTKHSFENSTRSKIAFIKSSLTASDVVLDIISKSGKGTNFAEIQTETGFGEKKLRNIIFRLNQLEKIKRKSRGIYIA